MYSWRTGRSGAGLRMLREQPDVFSILKYIRYLLPHADLLVRGADRGFSPMLPINQLHQLKGARRNLLRRLVQAFYRMLSDFFKDIFTKNLRPENFWCIVFHD